VNYPLIGFTAWAAGVAVMPATASAAAAASPAAPTPMPAESGPKLSGLVAGGGSSRWLYGIPIRGVDVSVGLGGKDTATRLFNVYAVPHFFFGSTSAGLDVKQLTIGARAEWRFGGFAYAGGNVAAGMLWLDRVRGSGMTNATASASLFLGPELMLGNSAAAGIDIGGSIEYAPGSDDTLIPGAGVELRLHRRRRDVVRLHDEDLDEQGEDEGGDDEHRHRHRHPDPGVVGRGVLQAGPERVHGADRGTGEADHPAGDAGSEGEGTGR